MAFFKFLFIVAMLVILLQLYWIIAGFIFPMRIATEEFVRFCEKSELTHRDYKGPNIHGRFYEWHHKETGIEGEPDIIGIYVTYWGTTDTYFKINSKQW